MFRKLSTEEKLQKERERNLTIMNRQSDLEDALLEIARMITDKKEGDNNG